MPVTVKVLVRKEFDHEGRTVKAGEMIAMTPIDAAIRSRQGYVNLSKQAIQTRDMKSDEAPSRPARAPRAPRASRQYLRADMTAESNE